MYSQVWNDVLATMAETWASGCDWTHGHPTTGPGSPFSHTGQNLYMVSGARALNVTAGIQAWYDEKPDYNYDTQRCAVGRVCGHYTQVPRPHFCPALSHYGSPA